MHSPISWQPLVSVVIPTHSRADVLPRAIRSALAQTYRELEVVVVVDGPDPETTRVLSEINDPRIKSVQLESNLGGGDARNAGVAVAHGEWIAFLDDDDEWLPEKIGRQIGMAQGLICENPIISCRFIAHTTSGEYVWPKRFPKDREPISEYLLVRDGLGQGTGNGDGFIATPTILTRKSLLQSVPFRSLKKHQDWDWVLRATAERGVKVSFCPEALAICHMENTNSTGRKITWEYSLQWIRANRGLMTPKAYAGFVATHIGWQAAADRAWRAFIPLLWDAFRNGTLRPIDVLRYCLFWIISPPFRSTIRRCMRRRSNRSIAIGFAPHEQRSL